MNHSLTLPIFFLNIYFSKNWLIFLLSLSFVVAANCEATAFLLDPSKPGAPAFGRLLWDKAAVATPGPDGIVGTPDDGPKVLTLRYAFQSKAPDINFIWRNPGPDGKVGTADDGPSIVKKNDDFSKAQKNAVRAAATTWNTAATNPASGSNLNMSGANLKGKFDLESIALHEFGHTLGLGHPNVGPGNYAAAGNNYNVANNPFVSPAIVDSTTLTPSNVVAAQGGARPLANGVKGTEAVMVQGSVPDEIQRTLQFDDIQGLRGLQSGPNFKESDADDFVFFFQEVGENDPHEINLFNINLAGIGSGLTRSILDGAPTPSVHQVREFLDVGLDPFGSFSITTSLTDMWFTSANPDDPAYIGFADIFFAAPEPGTPALLLAGLLPLMFKTRNRATRRN